MQPDIQPETEGDATAGQREYALAKAYTEVGEALAARALQLKFCAFLLLVLMPLGYALLTPLVARGWFRAWTEATASLGLLLAKVFRGIATTSNAIYGTDSTGASQFMSVAGLDLLCVMGATVFFCWLFPRPSLRPKPGGMQIKFLNDLARGFPLGKRRSSPRIGGEAGGLALAVFMTTLILWGLHAAVLEPTQNGRFFADLHADCAASPSALDLEPTGESAPTGCLELAAWHMGWRASLAGVAIPAALLIALNYALYPIWLLRGKPKRVSPIPSPTCRFRRSYRARR